jgi:tetratricopeptide (TPR) repeat protein
MSVHISQRKSLTGGSSPLLNSRATKTSGFQRHRKANGKVCVRAATAVIPTYLPAPPDKNPMFLEKRVYQGSSGRVYPLPFTDRIAEKPVARRWKVVWLENEFLRVMVLPELGGRIHALQDKTNGYEAIYRQAVIKPALVGLAGPWLSGGIEFNWPQHHRPATFRPVNFEIEEHPDGSKTVWCSDHDPMARMKGMHGVCLHPGKSFLELKVRAYNRTPFVQTFLWWANVATRVHEAYQSFFPPDVYYVADHARRSMSAYPLCEGFYYGVNYGERGRKGVPAQERPSQFTPPHCADSRITYLPSVALAKEGPASRITPRLPNYAPNDLSFYANIPTPCSYMCMGSKADFFGGYDYAAQAGIVHWANHHIAPGKKQWTWGNHEFGYAWDRNLTEKDEKGEYGPYIEIMAGVYTDNQPDFSFLQPGETKAWSQYWYPIQKIGPAQKGNLEAALSVRPISAGCQPATQPTTSRRYDGKWVIGVAVTRRQPGVQVRVMAGGKPLAHFKRDLSPATPLLEELKLLKQVKSLAISVCDQAGRELIAYEVKPRSRGEVPPPATEPPVPAEIASADELFITGLHLEQYRHATRCPTLYWNEALRRDPLDARCNNAVGLWHLRRGEFTPAEGHFRRAIERLTRRNANPYDGEAYYNLGLCLRYLDRDEEAYAAFYKAAWNQAWVAASYHALAEIDCSRKAWACALGHLERSLRFNADNTRAQDLKAVVLRKLGRKKEAKELLAATLALDPLDWWARCLQGETLGCDLQTVLDLALDFIRAGLYPEAIALLRSAARTTSESFEKAPSANGHPTQDLPDQSWGAAPQVLYYLGWLYAKMGDAKASLEQYRSAAAMPPDYCFPARLDEIAILQAAMRANPGDARAPYYLGNLLYDRRRHEEGIRMWERAAKLDPNYSTVWRNLGIGYFNIHRKPARASAAYDKAVRANPDDARLLYERDQLWKRMGIAPSKRLQELEKHPKLVQQRDDLSVELCALYNHAGRHQEALALVSRRHFQPWEGGEGGPLGQHIRSHLALGRKALARGKAGNARDHFEAALNAPVNLGEAKHLLANQSDIHYWLGCAYKKLGDKDSSRKHWLAAATFKGDFQQMSIRSFSEMTYYSALSWMRLGRKAAGRKLLNELLAYACKLVKTPAKIDYFATSLPTMLLFDDDLQFRQYTTALFLQAQAHLGLGRVAKAKSLMRTVLRREPSHAPAANHLKELSAR